MLKCVQKQWKVAVGGRLGGLSDPRCALIREALGQRRVGVAVQPSFNTITTTVIIIIIVTIVMTSVTMITLQLSSLQMDCFLCSVAHPMTPVNAERFKDVRNPAERQIKTLSQSGRRWNSAGWETIHISVFT